LVLDLRIILGTGASSGRRIEDGSEDESGDERPDDDQYDDDDDDSGEWVSESDEEEPEWERRIPPLSEGNGHTMKLTHLLEECRVMNEGRDEG
jgi:hypothetical protein